MFFVCLFACLISFIFYLLQFAETIKQSQAQSEYGETKKEDNEQYKEEIHSASLSPEPLYMDMKGDDLPSDVALHSHTHPNNESLKLYATMKKNAVPSDVALHSYTHKNNEALSFNEGQALDVMDNTQNDQCLTRTGSKIGGKGIRPSNYENVLPEGKLICILTLYKSFYLHKINYLPCNSESFTKEMDCFVLRPILRLNNFQKQSSKRKHKVHLVKQKRSSMSKTMRKFTMHHQALNCLAR